VHDDFNETVQPHSLPLDSGRFGAGLEGVGQATLATVLTVVVQCHEDTSSALSSGTFTTEALDLAIRVDPVVFQDRHLDLLALVLDLFGSVVSLLLSLLSTTTKTQNQMEGGLLLDVVIGKSTAVLELLASKDQTLLVRGNALFILDLGFDIVNSIGGFDLESDSFTREGLYENLHLVCARTLLSVQRSQRWSL